MNGLKKFVDLINRLNQRFGDWVSWLSTILVVVVCFDVFTRYVMRKSSVAVQEAEWHIFALMFLFGAAYTLGRDKHVRVDVLYTRMTEKKKALVDFFGSLIFLIPYSILIIVTSHTFVYNSYRILEGSPDPGGLPLRFLLKAAIPLGFVLVTFQGLAMAGEAFLKIMKKDADQEDTNA